MHDQVTRAAALAAIAHDVTPADTLPGLAFWPAWNAATLTAACGQFAQATEPAAPAPVRLGRVRRLARFARSAARHPIATGKTLGRAAKLVFTVRRAVPWYVWPILALAALVKCMPLDMGTDEALFALAFVLLMKRRPGLVKALWREASAGKPARCQCDRHASKAAR